MKTESVVKELYKALDALLEVEQEIGGYADYRQTINNLRRMISLTDN